MVWRVVSVDVSGAGSDTAQAWLQALATARLEELAEVCVHRVLEQSAKRDRATAQVPLMRLRVRLRADAVHLRMEQTSGFGQAFDASMPVFARGEDASPRDIVGRIDQAVTSGLQAMLAMREIDARAPEQLRLLAAGDRVAGPRIATEAGHVALQTFAIRRIAQRRDRDAAPYLRQLVAAAAAADRSSPAPLALGLQAVGSLMALCDREAVLPIIALAQHQEADVIVQLAHVIAEVGGPMAEAYLLTLASGHLDTRVRQGAAVALEHGVARRRTGLGCEGNRSVSKL